MKRTDFKKHAAALLLVLCLLVTSALPALATSANIKLVDSSGNPTEQVNPIVGATVRWDDAVYTTDENGQVTIAEELRTVGAHAVSIEKKAENEPVDGKYLYAVLPLESGYTVTVEAADVSDSVSEAEPSEAESSAAVSSEPQTPDTGDGLPAYTAAALMLVVSLAMLRRAVRKTR